MGKSFFRQNEWLTPAGGTSSNYQYNMGAGGKVGGIKDPEVMASRISSTKGFKGMANGFFSNFFKSKSNDSKSSSKPDSKTKSVKKETTKKELSSDKIEGITPEDDEVDILEKIFTLIEIQQEEKTKWFDNEDEDASDLAKIKESRHREIMNIFRVKPKRKRKKKEEEEKKEPAAKPEPGKPEPGKPEPTKVEPSKPTESAAPAPKVTTPKPTAEKVPSIPKPIVAGAAAVGLAGIAQKVSARESAGSYTQANIVKDTPAKEANIVRGNIDVTTGQPFDRDLTQMTIAEAAALGERRFKYYKGKGGSALGKYQFIPGTLRDQAKKLYGDNWANRLYDERAQEDLNMSFIQSNAEALKKAGIPVSDASIYMMHFFGNTLQAGMVINGSNDTKMKDILDYYWNKKTEHKPGSKSPSEQNPSVALLTVGQYKASLGKTFDFKPLDSNLQLSPPNINTPTLIKGELFPKNGSPSVISNNQTNVYNPTPIYTINEEKSSTRSPLIENQYN